ncbi:MAG: methyltransferase domain-containing protein [Candidatus Thorarchaeota archaeon]
MSSFDNLSLVYDRSINWDARLRRELPFILNSLSESGGTRVLDMACGSGRHSVALALEGADVVGFDSSTSMIQAAKELAAENGVATRFMVADMTNLETVLKEKFDLIVCLGNSLALVPSLLEVKKLLSAVHSLLNSKGVFVAQVLNFEQIKKTKSRFFQPKGGVTSEGNLVVFARFFSHLEPEESTTLVLTSFVKSSEAWSTTISSQSVLQLDQEALTQAVRAAGFGQFEVYSDYGGNPFTRTEHRNLVIRARK